MSANTGTATTATADPHGAAASPVAAATTVHVSPAPANPSYTGRFAPSPTGDLHLGSLVAALGSYLDARHHGGRWLLRMEDLDTPRVLPGCADRMLRTLECFGLLWDGQVTYQSRDTERYMAALEMLRQNGRTFECGCSRRLRPAAEDQGYPGTCRDKPPTRSPTATRFRIDDHRTVTIDDRFQGECHFELRTLGDVIIRRRDGIVAYQLAVVVDDGEQHINHVVRGADLLASTAWQVSLQDALGLPRPSYGHLPLVVEPDGSKLAKSARSIPLNPQRASPLLISALKLLRQAPPADLEREPPRTILAWAIEHWNPRAFHGMRAVHAI